LRFFPGGFTDETYLAWERDYKEQAHQRWIEVLSPARFRALIEAKRFADIAAEALRIEAKTNLLFSFEKMALRDAVRSMAGAERFAVGLYQWLHGRGDESVQFDRWCNVVADLPRRQTRVLTWPVVTVFGFLAQPDRHIFLKPNVTRIAAARYGFALDYRSRPSWATYGQLLDMAGHVQRDLHDLHPRDMIDVQSFLWVQGSEEYSGRAFKPAFTTLAAVRDKAADRSR
jgi:hypothetical protein